MKVTILNQHANNFGDEAAGLALIHELLCHYEIECINILYIGKGKLHINNERVVHNDYLSLRDVGKIRLILRFILAKFHIPYQGNSALQKYISIISHSDLVFVSPAGADIGIYKGWASLLTLYIADSCKKQIIFHLNTINDSKSKLFNFLAYYILKKSQLFVREQASISYLRYIGLQPTFGIDTAFLLDTPIDVHRNKNTITLVATSLSNWNIQYKDSNIENKVFREMMLPLCDYAKEHGFVVQLLTHLGTQEEVMYLQSIVEGIKRSMGNDVLLQKVDTAYEYQNEIAKSKLVIGMRYHAVVLAAKNSIPFISIAYENKMKEVCDYMGMSEFNIDVKEICQKNFLQLLENLIHNEHNVMQNLSRKVQDLRDLARLPTRENCK